jgi:hypothetical protein
MCAEQKRSRTMRRSATYIELAQRKGDSIAVSLLWRRDDNRLKVAVAVTSTGDEFELDALPENALDVFYHPFAYAAFRGLDYDRENATSPASAEALAA